MATGRPHPWYILLFVAVLWPLKVTFVYFLNCAFDVAQALGREWTERKRYTGWER